MGWEGNLQAATGRRGEEGEEKGEEGGEEGPRGGQEGWVLAVLTPLLEDGSLIWLLSSKQCRE